MVSAWNLFFSLNPWIPNYVCEYGKQGARALHFTCCSTQKCPGDLMKGLLTISKKGIITFLFMSPQCNNVGIGSINGFDWLMKHFYSKCFQGNIFGISTTMLFLCRQWNKAVLKATAKKEPQLYQVCDITSKLISSFSDLHTLLADKDFLGKKVRLTL